MRIFTWAAVGRLLGFGGGFVGCWALGFLLISKQAWRAGGLEYTPLFLCGSVVLGVGGALIGGVLGSRLDSPAGR